MSDILSKILPNHENDLMLLKRYLDRLTFYEKEQGKAKRAVALFIEEGEEATVQFLEA